MHRPLGHTAQGLIFWVTLLAVAAIYWPALNNHLMFDDQQTLADLSTVTNLDSAIQFIFSGHAGPLGRPLALASFSLQAYAWPDHPEILLRTNVLLHILNGAFLAWSLLLLGRLRGISAPQAEWGAIASSALWLVIPLLASSSLFIVQRMATLSATFMLLGLLGYLATRCRLDSQPKRALAGMSLSLVTFTVLATLSKESGALLPILILVIESALLRARLFKISVITRTWGLLFLILPLVAILIFIATQATYSEHMLLRREFTAGQRLWTQAEILWQYLLHAFIPMQSQLTPFHDHLKPSPSPLHPTTLIAIAAWGAAIGAAIRFRKRLPLLAFALAWYLGEHLLESTVLNLELYFAHRNYLALIGPVYALVASILTIPAPQAKLAHTLLAAYILVMAASLYSITTLWGRPAFAAEIWAIYNPDSIRANQNLAAALHQERWHSAALNVLNKTYSIDPGRRAATGIQALTLACAMQPDSDHSELATALISQVKTAQFDNDLPQNLLELQRLLLKEPCTGVDLETIEALTQNTLTNPVYASSARTKNNLHAVLTELAIAQKDFGKTMTHIEDSLRIMPTLDTLRLAIKVLTAAGRTDLGQGFIDMTRKGMPKHPIKRLDWQRQLDQLERQLAEVNATQQALQAQEAQ